MIEIITKLNGNSIDWAISDGIAVFLYGVDIEEDDIDIMVKGEDADIIEKVFKRKFRSEFFEEKTIAGKSTFIEFEQVELYYDLTFFKDRHTFIFSLTDEVMDNVTRFRYNDESIVLMSAEDVILKKLISQRDKDIRHVKMLLKRLQGSYDWDYIQKRINDMKIESRIKSCLYLFEK